MNSPVDAAMNKLSDIQRQAAFWDQGSLLVLAGPGSGKTQVLTCRITHLLEASNGQSFRILALTFTNKAADEMKERISALAPGLEERTFVGTFHSFCGQVLRQHGVHIGIKPNQIFPSMLLKTIARQFSKMRFGTRNAMVVT